MFYRSDVVKALEEDDSQLSAFLHFTAVFGLLVQIHLLSVTL